MLEMLNALFDWLYWESAHEYFLSLGGHDLLQDPGIVIDFKTAKARLRYRKMLAGKL